MKPLGGEQVVAAPLHHQHSTTTFISVLFGSGYGSSDQLWGQICVCLSDCLSVCVSVCVFSDVDVEVYKMHNLALPFHQLPFSSCPACLSFPSSPSPSLSLSLRLVSSLRLFFIFILAFVFIDSQVVWLFHFSFGRKTFDLPPPTLALTHPHPHTPSTHS